MKLHQFRALITVAERGTIREAARAMHLTQPAISKALQELEAELEVPLLTRSASGVVLTPYGHALIRRARVIEQELQRAQEDIDALRGVANMSLSIGVTPVTGTVPFGVALRQFIRDYPQVGVNVLEMRPADIQNGVLDGTLDFGVISRVGAPQDARFYWEILGTTPTALAVRSGHALRGPCTLSSLVEQGWLIWDAIDDPTSVIASIFEHHGIAPPGKLVRCTSTSLYRDMSTDTDLISLWSERVFEQPERAGKLRRLELNEALPDMTIGLVCRKLELITPIATELVARTREAAGLGRAAPA